MKEGIRRTLVFDLKDLRHEDFKQYEALVPSETLGLIFEEAEFVNPLSCTILLLRQGGNNMCVTADITSVISVECRRCVIPFEIDVATTLDLFFFFKDGSSEQDEADERYYDGETLDISEDVRQAVMLEIPMWPLCSETCDGLCPQCGTELNAGVCACEIEDEVPVTDSNPLSTQLASIFSEADLSKKLKNS
jgi:uncharacterized protein